MPVETKEDCRIFEELAFCIFTANTSAEMGAKAVDAVRNVLINGTADDMTRRLEGIYRFNNVRPAHIIHTRNYLKNSLNFQLKNKIKSFKDKNELRNFFALNKDIKGLGMKEASHFLRNIGYKDAKEILEMRKHAYDEAENIKIGSNNYAESVLTSLDKDLTEALSIVRNGQKHLMSKSNEEKFSHNMQSSSNGRDRDRDPAVL